MRNDENTRILLDIQKQVGHIGGVLESVKELGEKTHVQASQTTGRVTLLEKQMKEIQFADISNPNKVSVKQAIIKSGYTDRFLLIGAALGSIALGLMEVFNK